MRVFNNPNHANYGSVRRLFVALSTLFSDIEWPALERAYRREWGMDWDAQLISLFPDYGTSDAPFHREIVQRMIVAFDNR